MLVKLKKSGTEIRKELLSFLENRKRKFRISFGFSSAEIIFEEEGAAPAAEPEIRSLDFVEEVFLGPGEEIPSLLSSAPRERSGFEIIAGPCAVEDENTYMEIAAGLVSMGIKKIRAALKKPRRSPHAFQGMGREGIASVMKAKRRFGVETVSEIMSPSDIAEFGDVCDILQIGARNMRNYDLLKEAGRSGKPVILKRAAGSGMMEWLKSAEYLARFGAKNIVLCERGDAGVFGKDAGINFNVAMRARDVSGLPAIVDVTHSSGGRVYAFRCALGAKAMGLDGIMIETHSSPQKSLVDGKYSVALSEFRRLAAKLGSM